MSGGSWNYLSFKIDDAADRLCASPNMKRRALGEHLRLVAKAMHDIEWVDSCDYGPGDDEAAIRACLAPGAEVAAATSAALEARDAVDAAIARATAPKEGSNG